MALRDLTTSSPLIPLASPSHPPRIPLTPYSRPYTSPSSPSRLSIPCMHHARVHREHRESCTYIHSQHLKDNTRGYQGPAPGPRSCGGLRPIQFHRSTYPHHLHITQKSIHTHTVACSHTHTHDRTRIIRTRSIRTTHSQHSHFALAAFAHIHQLI